MSQLCKNKKGRIHVTNSSYKYNKTFQWHYNWCFKRKKKKVISTLFLIIQIYLRQSVLYKEQIKFSQCKKVKRNSYFELEAVMKMHKLITCMESIK